MGNTICGWHRSELKAKYLLEVLDHPQYFCKECGRVANKKKYLCEPKNLYKKENRNS